MPSRFFPYTLISARQSYLYSIAKGLAVAALVLLISDFGATAGEVKLITNRDHTRSKTTEVNEAPYEGNIYDLSFVAYDKDFAEEFGLDPTFVTDMDKGLRFMEIKMVTEGMRTNCYYNVILDKSIEVDFPAENYVQDMRYPEIHFPYEQKITDDQKKHSRTLHSSREFKEYDKFMHRTYMGNRGYIFNTTGKPFSNGSAFDVNLAFYIQDRKLPYQIITVGDECGGAGIYQFPEPAFWIRKKGKQENANLPRLDNYYTFLIPERLYKEFYPILIEYEKYHREKIKQQIEKHQLEKKEGITNVR